MTAQEARDKTSSNIIEKERLSAVKRAREENEAIAIIYEEIEKSVNNGKYTVSIDFKYSIILGTDHEQRLIKDGYKIEKGSGKSSITISWHPKMNILEMSLPKGQNEPDAIRIEIPPMKKNHRLLVTNGPESIHVNLTTDQLQELHNRLGHYIDQIDQEMVQPWD